jgi:cytochrome c oxidase cbb3-type subunit 1
MMTGGRHLIGGPVPAWIPTLANAACWMVLFHFTVVGLNLRGALTGGGTSLTFISFGLLAYLAGAVLDAVTSFRGVALVTQFTYFTTAQQQLALYGAISMLLFGSVYFALPRLIGRPWISGSFVRSHMVLSMVGIFLLVGSLAVAGLIQGTELINPKTTFGEIADRTRPWLLAVSVVKLPLIWPLPGMRSTK